MIPDPLEARGLCCPSGRPCCVCGCCVFMALLSLPQGGDQLPPQAAAAAVPGAAVGLFPARRQGGAEAGQAVPEGEAPGHRCRAAASSGQVPKIPAGTKEPWKTQRYHTEPLLFWLSSTELQTKQPLPPAQPIFRLCCCQEQMCCSISMVLSFSRLL